MTGRAILIREAKLLGIFVLLAVVQTLLMCRNCTTARSYLLVGAFTLAMWILLYRGNALLTDYVSCKISWIDHPGKRFITGIVTTVAYTLLSALGVMFLFSQYLGFNFGGSYRSTIVICVTLTLVISLFLHCREFLSFWRKASFDAARFQRESIAAKYEALKNQVNPAFLFHSLNALSGLVYDDEEKAVRYIKALADVYRYVLDTREKEIVPVSEELDFLRSYSHLLRIRYGIDLQIMVTGAGESYVPPSAFHMIIENILPHDGESGNLGDRFTVSAGEGVIELQFPSAFSSSVNGAFDNVMERIRSRYSFLTDERVSTREQNGFVKVTLPLIQM